jgi:hypothetical protein
MTDHQDQQQTLEYLQRYGYLGPAHGLTKRTDDALSVEPGDNVFGAVQASSIAEGVAR